jgi:hypothetical protein
MAPISSIEKQRANVERWVPFPVKHVDHHFSAMSLRLPSLSLQQLF